MSPRPVRDWYRTMTTTAMLAVALIAASVSFLHIESLAVKYGQPPMAAWLLPLSIDGTVAVSSLAMLRSARSGVTTPAMARAMLILAVVATLAANVAFGLPHGWPGALLSGWPAVAFIGSAEVAIGMSRPKAAPSPQVRKTKVTAPEPVATVAVASVADTEAAILASPDMTSRELAALTGVSDRTVRRVRARLNGHAERVAIP